MSTSLIVRTSKISRNGIASSRTSWRNLQTASKDSSIPSQTTPSVAETTPPEPLTHYKITLRRSAIGLPSSYPSLLSTCTWRDLVVWCRRHGTFGALSQVRPAVSFCCAASVPLASPHSAPLEICTVTAASHMSRDIPTVLPQPTCRIREILLTV